MIAHRQSTFSIICNGSRNFLKWEVSICFSLKSPAALVPNKKVSLSFEDLNACNDISTLDFESLRWHLLPIEGCFPYTESLFFTVATFINDLSWVFLVTCCSFYISSCSSPCTFLLQERLLLSLINHSLLASNFLPNFLTSRSLRRTEES